MMAAAFWPAALLTAVIGRITTSDIDKDGDPTIESIGDDGNNATFTLYRNDNSVFNPVATGCSVSSSMYGLG
ncbi:MAG: hypothetical protein R2867_13270 [Caldilineaceae bacterium]